MLAALAAARPLLRLLIPVGIGLILGAGMAWTAADLWFGAKLATAEAALAHEQAGRAADRTAIATAAAEAAQRHQVQIRQLQLALADADVTHMKELRDAQTRVDQLRADLRSGTRRLRVPVRCTAAPAGRGGVPRAAPAISPGDGAASQGELPGPVADALVALVGRADEVSARLRACQDYARTISKRTGP
jgi:hypothetical protein